MGPPKYSIKSSNTDNNDDKIADLELQIAAHAARAAKLHARLMATLDTLDSERCTYVKEISDERRQRIALQAQLRAARTERAAMEAERDSLREGVLHLIEKVELCNDYSLWPHSGLASTSLAAPPKPRTLHEQSQTTWTASARAYSVTLITASREECERERGARSEAQRRVAELEAQLARREAELEERYDTAPTSYAESPLPRLSRDGAIRVLQQSAARNEALTEEIAGLVQKLEEAQVAPELGTTRAMTPPPSSPTSPHAPSPPESPTPQRHPARPLILRSPASSSSKSPSRRHSRGRRPTRSPSPPLLSSRASSPAGDLARQIAAVTESLAGLRAEERRITQTCGQVKSRSVPLPQRVRPRAATPLKRTFPRVLLVEEECIRLRAELAASTAREVALRELLLPASASASAPTGKDVFGDDYDDDDDSMVLATPLQPTVLLNSEDLWPG
ncbi:hypothetical protein B0F90DRAFT_1731250 [Multifurca ochricompacta]|uniref:Uncharacterized protein n=1 Tax=Multifurca ochricompacta TaxID=376703 RepID=A0AAD4M2F4_9AGAM|nr:hypothetical protein B0F90DRAFT_1731250 [Multifurca ochricompacta]